MALLRIDSKIIPNRKHLYPTLENIEIITVRELHSILTYKANKLGTILDSYLKGLAT